MKHRVLFAAFVAALILAGCAPSAQGTRSNPFDLRHDRTVTTTRASTSYVLVAFDHGAFGYDVRDLSGRWIPWGVDGAAATVTPLFSLRDLVGPDGWNLDVQGVRAFDLPGRRGVAIEATLRLDVPAGARPGGPRLRAVLEARNGHSQPFEIIVHVVP